MTDTPFEVPGLDGLLGFMVHAELAELASRAGSLVSALPASEAPDARRVLALVGELVVHGDSFGPPDADTNIAARVELRGLAERLGRRSAEGIPFASLARAVSASLHESIADARQIRAECDGQLATFGL